MKVWNLKYGVFEATNGKDTVTAEYKRARPKQANDPGSRWVLTLKDGRVFTVYGDKDDAMARVKQLLVEPTQRPMSMDLALSLQETLGAAHGIVDVPIGVLLSGDKTQIDNYAKVKLLREDVHELVTDIAYWPVNTTIHGGVCLRVAFKLREK